MCRRHSLLTNLGDSSPYRTVPVLPRENRRALYLVAQWADPTKSSLCTLDYEENQQALSYPSHLLAKDPDGHSNLHIGQTIGRLLQSTESPFL